MKILSLIVCVPLVAASVGCEDAKNRPQTTTDRPAVKVEDRTGTQTTVDAPGANVNVDRSRQTTVDAPGVKVDAGPDGTRVRAPGADVDVNKK
jgi:hypothetical protein